jgi:dockerin type I repeat protein
MRKCASALTLAMLAGPAAMAHAHEFMTRAILKPDGAGNSSLGTGTILVKLDLDLITMDVDAQFANLSSASSSASIHGLTALPHVGSAIEASPLPGFPSDVTTGSYSSTIDLTVAPSYSSGFITASGGTVGQALNALIFGLVNERMYASISTNAFGSGEISGFFRAFPDANHDRVIDTQDFLAVGQNFNTLGTELDLGDFNLDGRTNALDFNILATHFGESAAFPAAAVVPEPVTIGVAAAAALVVCRRSPVRRSGKTLTAEFCGRGLAISAGDFRLRGE